MARRFAFNFDVVAFCLNSRRYEGDMLDNFMERD
jgi:hypothetical protein